MSDKQTIVDIWDKWKPTAEDGLDAAVLNAMSEYKDFVLSLSPVSDGEIEKNARIYENSIGVLNAESAGLYYGFKAGIKWYRNAHAPKPQLTEVKVDKIICSLEYYRDKARENPKGMPHFYIWRGIQNNITKLKEITQQETEEI